MAYTDPTRPSDEGNPLGEGGGGLMTMDGEQGDVSVWRRRETSILQYIPTVGIQATTILATVPNTP